jgi:hypothetical protein
VIPDASFSGSQVFTYGFGNLLAQDIGGCQGVS